MAIGGRGITVRIDNTEVRRLASSAPIARDLQSKLEAVTQEAKRLAPVSPHGSNGRPSGYLRSQIGWDIGEDADGLYGDVATPATSVDGAPYGLFQEVGTSKMEAQPHIRPALSILRRYF